MITPNAPTNRARLCPSVDRPLKPPPQSQKMGAISPPIILALKKGGDMRKGSYKGGYLKVRDYPQVYRERLLKTYLLGVERPCPLT
ncbi:hypothetical protein HHE06_01890 [Helicobacter heilmannii]|nr:hypothetical protein HHE06_01890 [Helicobacter heilmannii]